MSGESSRFVLKASIRFKAIIDLMCKQELFCVI